MAEAPAQKRAGGLDRGRALARAAKMRGFHVRLYQALSAVFTPAYQSGSRVLPLIRDWIVPPFSRIWPATRIQAEMVAGTFGGPLKPLGLEAWGSRSSRQLQRPDTGAIADVLLLPYWFWGASISAAILALLWWSFRLAFRR